MSEHCSVKSEVVLKVSPPEDNRSCRSGEIECLIFHRWFCVLLTVDSLYAPPELFDTIGGLRRESTFPRKSRSPWGGFCVQCVTPASDRCVCNTPGV